MEQKNRTESTALINALGVTARDAFRIENRKKDARFFSRHLVLDELATVALQTFAFASVRRDH